MARPEDTAAMTVIRKRPVVLQLQDQALKGLDIEFLHNFFRAK